MVKAVIFDMYETLVTQYSGDLYFGEEIAKDLQIEERNFMPIWKGSQNDRSIGKITFEEVIENVMREYNLFSLEKFNFVVERRMNFEKEVFSHMNEEVIPMLRILKDKGIKLGLITNCFSEEVTTIQQSCLFELFDATCLSFLSEVPAIFR